MTRIKQITTDYLFKEETDGIISAFYDVYNALGAGFLERVYQNALYIELLKRGYECEAQKKINVYYRGVCVGEYFADILVNNRVILELKATDDICLEHELQLINYLKATDIQVGLLLNFGPHPQIRRKLYTNDKKENQRSSVESASSVCHDNTDKIM